MSQPVIINKFGTLQGWNSVTVPLFGRDLEGITAISYSDEVEKSNAYGANKYPIGREEKNYSAEASITLLKEEVDALMSAIPPGTRLQDIPPFSIPVIYESKSGRVQKDVIQNCEFTGNSRDVTQGDGSIAIQYELLPSHIDWNV